MKHSRSSSRSLDPNTVAFIRHLVMGVVVVGFVLMVLMGIWYGSRVEALTLRSVQVEGGETIAHDIVREAVEAELTGTYLGLVPKRFAWSYPKQAVREAVLAIDRVKAVDVGRVNGRTLSVQYLEYIPRALWCTAVDSTECLLLDVSGYAFALAPELTGGRYLRFVEVGQEPQLGEFIAETALIDSAVATVRLLEDKGWVVSHVEVGREGDVFLLLQGGGELKVDLTVPPEETVENLLVILRSEEFSHLAPGNFQYIDLRFGNKVFVNEELAVPKEETASGTASSTRLVEPSF